MGGRFFFAFHGVFSSCQICECPFESVHFSLNRTMACRLERRAFKNDPRVLLNLVPNNCNKVGVNSLSSVFVFQ